MNLFAKLLFVLMPCMIWAQPKANFGANETKGCGILQVVFIDSSSVINSNIVSWKWDLGNGLISDKQSPGRIFDKQGSYNICLTVTDASGLSDKVCKNSFINVYAKPEPNFLIDITKGCSPVTANLKDLSMSANGSIKEWIWDIGGSSNVITSLDKNQSISSTYTSMGNYSMSLKIKDEKGCEATISKKDLLQVIKPPAIALQKKIIAFCELPWQLELKNGNIDPNAQYTWIFGNGQQYQGSSPPIVLFNEKKNYDLIIITKKGECVDTSSFKEYVNTNPKNQIEVDKPNYCLGDEVSFKDVSDLGADSIKWNFGDGFSSTAKAPKHTYNLQGCFVVKLFRFRGNCMDTVVYNCVNVIKSSKPQYTIDNQFTCTIPIKVNAKGVTNGTYEWNLKGPNLDLKDTKKETNFTVNQFGKFKLFLNYTNPAGCLHKDSSDIDINKFEAYLPSKNIGGCVPYQVDLGDSIITQVPVTKYDWLVGGNANLFSSTLPKPKFTLKEVGQFDVRLIVTNIYGCKDTVIRSGYVQGGTSPVVDFIAAPIDECLNIERNFSDNSSSNANFWIWNFGDNTGAEGKNSKHLYTTPGIYDVTLIAIHNGCAAVKTKQKLIKVLEPVSNYEIKYQCDDPNTITINNLTLGADSLYWEVFDGIKRDTIRDSILTSYTFAGRGKYTLQIYSKNFSTGCEHVRLDTVIITNPEAKFTPDTLKGCVPLTINMANQSTDALQSKYIIAIGDTLEANIVTYVESGKHNLPMLLITDIHGCQDSFKYDKKIFANSIKAAFKLDDIVCVPKISDLIDISTDSFSTINNYTWYVDNDTFIDDDTLQYNVLKPGNISVKLIVKDEWSCSDSLLIVNAFEAVLLTPNFTSDSLGCSNAPILFSPSGDNLNTKKYYWEFSDGTTDSLAYPKHNFVNEGKYNVCLTLYDVRGCDNKICKDTFVEIKNPKADFNGDPLMETCPPLLTHFTNKSTNAISYEWNFGDNNGLSFVENPAHIYFESDTFDVSLIAIRSDLCRDTLTFKDYVRVLGPRGKFEYEIEGNCVPLKLKFKASTDDYYRYFWDFGNGEIDSSQLLQINDEKIYEYKIPGVYTPKLVVSDALGCKRNFSKDQIIVNDISIDFSIEDSTLCGLPVMPKLKNKSFSSSLATYYNWKIINGIDTSESSSDDPQFNINNFGTYKIELAGKADNCTATLLSTQSIYVYPSPIANFDLPTALNCQYNDVSIVENSSVPIGSILSYDWFANNKSYKDKEIKIKFEKNGLEKIKLIVTSDKLCKDSITKDITILPNKKLIPIEDTLICIGENLLLDPDLVFDNDYNYGWYQENLNDLLCKSCITNKVSPLGTTNYIFEAINNNGCTSYDTVLVTVAPVPPPTIELENDTTLCFGIASILSVKNFNPSFNYNWVGIDESYCIEDCRKVRINASEDKIYIAKVVNQYGCTDFDSIKIVVEKSIPDFLIDEKYICEDGATQLSISNLTTLNWSSQNKILCNDCNTINVNPSKDTYYKATVKSKNNCLYNDSILVKLVLKNSIDAGEDVQLCLGESHLLQSKGLGTAVWMYENQPIGNGSNLSYNPTKSGIYTVSYNKDECTLHDSLYIDVLKKATIEAIGDTICFGDEINVKASGFATKYDWYIDDVKVSSDKQYQYSPKLTASVMVVGSRTTCESDTAIVLALVHPFIDYTLLKNDYSLYFNTKQIIETIGNTNQNYTYNWSPSEGLSCNNCPNPSIDDLKKNTTYSVEVEDVASGCKKEMNIFAKLKEECSPLGYYIPNAILTSSSSNNIFSISAANPDEFKSIVINDRWGNIVYHSTNINDTWDARLNGLVLESGVYMYIVTAICPETGELFDFAGNVTILH
jgi:PKD repeat protein